METKTKGTNEVDERIMKFVLEQILGIEIEDLKIRTIDGDELEQEDKNMECRKTKEAKERDRNEGKAIKQKEIILKLASKGYSVKLIANMLDLSEEKVRRTIEKEVISKRA